MMVIGREKDQAGYPYLLERLSDVDGDVCRAAVLSISRLENSEAIPFLLDVRLLEHASPDVREATVQALGSFGDLRVMEVLLKALEDPEWSVRIAVEEIMLEFIRRIVKEHDLRTARRLLRILSTSNRTVYTWAVKAFSRLGEIGFSLLSEHLFLSNARIRKGISLALSHFPGERPVPLLIRLLEDPHPEVRLSAVQALVTRRSSTALDPLIKCLTDFTPGVAEAAAQALAAYGDDCVKRLTHVLDRTPVARLKRNILGIFAMIASPACVFPALNHLGSGYYDVRLNAIETLDRIGQPALKPVLNLLERQTWFSSSLLGRLSSELNKRLKLRLIRSVGELKDTRCLGALERVLNSSDQDLKRTAHEAIMKIHCTKLGRYSALIVLLRLGDPGCLSPLRRLIRSKEEPDIKVMAIKVIEEIRDSKSRKLLITIIRSSEESPDVRAAAVDALKSLGASTVVDTLLGILDAPSAKVVRKAVRALGTCFQKNVIPKLIDRMKTAEGVLLKDIQLSITNFGEDAIPVLLSALKSAPPAKAARFADTFTIIAGDRMKDFIKRYKIPSKICTLLDG